MAYREEEERRRARARAKVEDWNRRYPVGTVVRYAGKGPVTPLTLFTVHRTACEAFLSIRKKAVVVLEGKEHAVPLESCTPREGANADEPR